MRLKKDRGSNNAVTIERPLLFPRAEISGSPRHRVLSLSVAATLALLTLLPVTGCKGRSADLSSVTRLFHHRRSNSKANTSDYAANLQTVSQSSQLATLKWSNFSDYQQEVQQFYGDRNWELAWTRDGKPTEAATRLINLFGDAAKKGLQPEDYDASRWDGRVQSLKSNGQNGDALAQFDAALTVTAMRYLSDLHLGRINPQALNFDIDVPARRAQFDLPTLLNEQLVDADDVTKAIDGLEPQNPMYKATEEALPHYLDLAKQEAQTGGQPLPSVAKTISPGGSYAGASELAQRLTLLGDGQVQATGTQYTPELSQAVQHFQARHGLNIDGKLSKDTIDALNVPMSVRVQQIADSLESWRWLPDNFVKPRVLVNLPEYYVRTYDAAGNEAFKMKVVDGQNKDDHNTPVFVRTMKFLIFRPYWNLPSDIVKKDLLKHASQGYFESHGYEVTDRGGKPIAGWSMDDLEHARYLVRQKPGPKNSLGLVKFMFPNEYDIYLHSTPEMNLFNLAQRDRSHGCVRLNDAEKMANWVLSGQGDWDADKIHQAMYGEPADNGDDAGAQEKTPKTTADADSGGSTTAPEAHNNKQVNLQSPLTVSLMYLTAVPDEDGSMHFYQDMYAYNKSLETELAKPRPYDQKPVKIDPKAAAGGTV